MVRSFVLIALCLTQVSHFVYAADPGATNPTAESAPTVPLESGPPAESQTPYGKEKLLVPGFSFGILATLFGFPTVFRGAIEVKYNNLLGLSFEYGRIPTIAFAGVSVGYDSWSVTGKVFPFKKAMFLALGVGQLAFGGSRTQIFSSQSTTASLTVVNTFVNPHIGWRWISKRGLVFGMEVGVQIPIATVTRPLQNSNPLVSASDLESLRAEIDEQAQRFGRIPLPWLAALQIGYVL